MLLLKIEIIILKPDLKTLRVSWFGLRIVTNHRK